MKNIRIIAVVSLTLNAIGIGFLLKGTPSAPPAPVRKPEAAATASAASSTSQSGMLPAAAARNFALGQSISRLHSTLRGIQPNPPPDPRYWHNASYLKNPYTREQRAAIAAAQREFAAGIEKATGEIASLRAAFDPRRSFLGAEKLGKLFEIEDDHAASVAAINELAVGLRLPSDEAKIKALVDARDTAIASLLAPNELAEVELRRAMMNPTPADASSLRARLAPVIETEDDYRKVAAIQKAFDEKYPDGSSATRGVGVLEAGRVRREAEPQLRADIRAALGEEKYATLVHATDSDRRVVQSLEQRLSLPAGTAEKVVEMRTRYAHASQQLAQDPALTAQDRNTRIVALGQQARAELNTLLGPDGGPAYVNRAAWIMYLARGSSIAGSPSEVPPTMGFSEIGFNSFPLSQVVNAAPAARGGGPSTSSP